MRWFRVPTFSGIEAAADDADRGTLRLAEGCLPVGPGGLHSGPVWETIGTVDSLSPDSNNMLTATDDAVGNSVLLASRNGQVHDVKVFPAANTDIQSTLPCYSVSGGSAYNSRRAYLSAVGNRLVAFGDGTSEAVFAGQGPPMVGQADTVTSSSTVPEAQIYHLEYSKFPNCRFFVVGPHKTLFAGGDPSNPLTIYISEPAGLTQPNRDSLYSLEATSSVNLLMTDASEVTALSCVAGNVAAHTDAGIFLLSPPTPDQASTGYRVEQAPTSVASAAVNLQVVAGEDGTQPYYLGFDGQIWRDPQGPGCEQKATYTDPVQASASAKGRWDIEQPADLSGSFAAYEPESGQYWVYIASDPAGWTEYEDSPDGSEGNSPRETQAPSGVTVLSQPSTAQSPSGVIILSKPTAAQSPSGITAVVAVATTAQSPSGITAITLVATAAQSPSGITAITLVATAAQSPSGITILSQPTTAQSPSTVTAIVAAPTTAQAPSGIAANVAAPTTAQAPSGIAANVVAPTTAQAPSGIAANVAAPTTAQAPSGVTTNAVILDFWTTGYNNKGQLGDGTTTNRTSGYQVLPSGVTQIAGGAYHSLFVKDDGSLWGMGYGSAGQLGTGNLVSPRTSPIQIVSSGVTQVAAGVFHSLFLKSDGSLWAMGTNLDGQLGDGTWTTRLSPVQILSSGVAQIAAGSYHSLFLKTDGSLWAMGKNLDGQLGDGTTTKRKTPVRVTPGNLVTNVVQVAAGGNHSLFIKSGGSLHTMGDNQYGQLGDGNSGAMNSDRTTPYQVLSSGVTQVDAGYNYSLFLKSDGSLHAMGSNSSGQFGDGTTTNSASPVQAVASGVTQIAAGGDHSLFLKSGGSLHATGYNGYGQLGDGTTTSRSSPVQVLSSGVTQIAGGGAHSLWTVA